MLADADKSAAGRIAGNGVSCYTAQAGRKGGMKQDVGIMNGCGNKKGVTILTIATP
jgi:hypothetical protein